MQKQISALCQVVRAVVVVALAFIHSFWIPNLFIVPMQRLVLGDYASVGFNVVVTILYVGIGVAAYRFPRVLARGATAKVAVCLSILGVIVLMLGERVSSAILLVSGFIILLMGSYWLNLFAHVSLAGMDPKLYIIGVSLSFPVARFAVNLLAGVGDRQGLALSIVLSLVIYVLARRRANATLSFYREIPPPYDLSVTNPSSFLPFTNAFFVVLFLFNLVYATLPIGEVDAAQLPLPMFTLVVPLLAIGYLIAKKKAPEANFLFQVAALLMAAAVLVPVAFPGTQSVVQYDLAGSGLNMAELLLCWYAVILLGSRNVLSILPTLVWGRVALSSGMVVGSILKATFAGDPQVMAVVSAGVAFLFIGYNLVTLRGFDFDVMANRTRPARVVKERADVAFGRGDEDAIDRMLVDRFRLTPRELEVCKLLARGRSYRYIEEKLVLSRNTVKSHIKNIYAKLDVHSQQALIDTCEEVADSVREA